MNEKERERNLKRRYGLTTSGWTFFYIQQGGKCGLCAKYPTKTDKLVVEHNHISKIVRGLTHISCNSRFKWFQTNKERILAWERRG